MVAAVLVFLLGCALTALGIITPTMYDIGVVVILIGGIGLMVRVIDGLRSLRR